MVSYYSESKRSTANKSVLILVVVDNGLVLDVELTERAAGEQVLILVVVDNGLVPRSKSNDFDKQKGLNPCCSGQWSRTSQMSLLWWLRDVLILVVVDNGLVQILKIKRL